MRMCRAYALAFNTPNLEDGRDRKGHLTPKGLQDRIRKAEAILRLVFEKELNDGYFELTIDDQYSDEIGK